MNIKRVCVLAVGTELITGQIVNSNAAWLSQQLTELGAETCWHLTVADDRSEIFKALEQAVLYADLILVTGGLGPTSDDFTREVIADWIGQTLAFDPKSWEQLEQRAQLLNFKLSASQKQQCYFPQGSQVLTNPAGTANAFIYQHQETLLVALPGPPNEIQAIWQAHLDKRLAAHLPGKAQQTLYRWQCMGLPEADLGEIVEEVVRGSGFQTGYRAHFPYIEVKLWVPTGQSGDPWLPQLDKTLAPWTLLKDDQDLAELLLLALPADQPILFTDAASRGVLAQRLQPFLSPPDQRLRQLSLRTLYGGEKIPTPLLQGLELGLEILETGPWRVTLQTPQRAEARELSPRYPSELYTRNQRYLVEQALEIWLNWLR
ncbi:MAG: competence/damage-inducible protein A [Candidatus Sericytochromatia bacterium]|nr:competence/damage-inducible protein A [Candidatus Sericytochromatia bacterium]